MADSIALYGGFMASLLNKEIDWDSDSLALMLTNGYVPNQDTHRYKSAVTNEVSGTGYTAGGKTLTGTAITYDSVNNRYTISADPVTWTAASFTADGAVLYDKTPATDATRPLVLFIGLAPARAPENGNLGFTWNVNGIYRFSIV